MARVRTFATISLIVLIAVFIAVWLATESRAQAPEKGSLVGAWTRNQELSDQPPARSERDDVSGGRGRRGGYGGGGGGGRGYGGGGRRGGYGGGNGASSGDPEAAARMRDALRDILKPAEHLTIVQTDTIVLLTAADGRTTRLAPDGKKIKDDNTKIERKTHWDSGKLVSEINGAMPGTVVQTFAVDPDTHQLRISLQIENGRDHQRRTLTTVYDLDK